MKITKVRLISVPVTTVDDTAILYEFTSLKNHSTEEESHKENYFDNGFHEFHPSPESGFHSAGSPESANDTEERESERNKIEFDKIDNQKIFQLVQISDEVFQTLKPSNSNVKRSKNRKSPREHRCEVCDKSFPSNYYLRFHENCVHKKQKTVACKICEKTFTEAYYLRQHEKRMHSDSRPFQCQHCSSSFRYVCSLYK